MTSLTTIAAISSFGRAEHPDHPGLRADFHRAAAEISRRSRRVRSLVAVLALSAAGVLPAHTASAAQVVDQVVDQVVLTGVKDTNVRNRVRCCN